MQRLKLPRSQSKPLRIRSWYNRKKAFRELFRIAFWLSCDNFFADLVVRGAASVLGFSIVLFVSIFGLVGCSKPILMLWFIMANVLNSK